ncbi:MAG TPA: beta-propeller fold lactonase family protein [Terriglobales bacterium]|jgi:6-phosphogluconolactonase (cycloisomerase 2 family)
MVMRFRRLGIVPAFVFLCLLIGCGNGSSNTSSTNTMYVATQSPGEVWGFRANFNNGSLTTINGSPFPAKAAATALVIEPGHNFGYVAESAPTNNIDSFSIDSNGSFVPGGSQAVGADPVALVMDAGGKYLFVAERGANSVEVFAVGSNAALTPAGAVAVTDPVALSISPTADFLYAVDQVDATVWIFHVDPNTGALSADVKLPPVPVGNTPSSVVMTPLPTGTTAFPAATGSFLYVTNRGDNTLSGFKIDDGNSGGTRGDLLSVGAVFSAATAPVASAVDPSGQFLYIVEHDSNEIRGFRITSGTGNLTALSASPYNTGSGPLSIAISPTNKFLYVSNNFAGTVAGYAIDPQTGNLGTALAPVTVGLQPVGIAFGR